jgi:diadenosine tetraphosphatase ApaH/serine/threonine PP2A family protein phosphatase
MPVKLALFSDLHANLHAVDACLAHARDQGAQAFAFLGDLVGYGAHPGAVIDRCMALQQEGAIVLRGNHECLALNPSAAGRTNASLTARWTHDALSPSQRAWLSGLKLEAIIGSAWLVHATAMEPASWHYMRDASMAALSLRGVDHDLSIRWVFCGHVHEQALYVETGRDKLICHRPLAGEAIAAFTGRRHLAVVGSVGQPRDGDPRACYLLFDGSKDTVCFHRVNYDYFAAAKAIRDAGLPEWLASRLEHGR